MNFNLNIQLNKNQISKLKLFYESDDDALETSALLPEITDTLKDMIVSVDYHQTKPNLAPKSPTADPGFIKDIYFEYMVNFKLKYN